VRDVREARFVVAKFRCTRRPLRRRIVALRVPASWCQAGATIEVRRARSRRTREHILAGDAAGSAVTSSRGSDGSRAASTSSRVRASGAAWRRSAAPARSDASASVRAASVTPARPHRGRDLARTGQAGRSRSRRARVRRSAAGSRRTTARRGARRQAGLGADAREHLDQGRAATDGDPREEVDWVVQAPHHEASAQPASRVPFACAAS